jgi:hypothetical protein
VGGSVLCERRGNAKEWVVLSHHHVYRPSHASGVCAAGGSGEARAPALRVMAWVEIIDVREPATTDWRLFRQVVRDGQPSPHRPRLVVSRSTCPPISSPPPRKQLLGPTVTHTLRQQIRDAAQKVPGLNLREMACYVDDGGTLVKPFDLSRLQRCDQEYIGFEFDGGERKDVKRRHVLPSADPEAV